MISGEKMKLLTVAIPILRRPKRIKPVHDYFLERTGGMEEIVFLPDEGDIESIETLKELGYNYLIAPESSRWGVQTYASKINYAFLNSNLEFFLYAADDVIPQPGWFDVILGKFRANSSLGVAVPNDNLTLAVQEGRGAPHAVVRRAYVERYGSASFPGAGVLMHEGYRHAFCDTELMETAKKRNAFLYIPNSILVHDRPPLAEDTVDEVYRLGLQSWKEDMMEFENRMLENKKMSIFVATPMHAGTCTDGFTQSCLGLQRDADSRGVDIKFVFLSGDSMITSARNTLAHAFLKSNCTHLLFIDSDISFDGKQVLDMVLKDVDIIGGVYPKKHISWDNIYQAIKGGARPEHLPLIASNYVVNSVAGGLIELGSKELIEVRHLGTGMMSIKREVFEALKSKVPTYVMGDALDRNYSASKEIPEEDKVYEFFSTEIDVALMTEDYYFCDLWRKNGGKIFLAPWVRLKHTGSYTFG